MSFRTMSNPFLQFNTLESSPVVKAAEMLLPVDMLNSQQTSEEELGPVEVIVDKIKPEIKNSFERFTVKPQPVGLERGPTAAHITEPYHNGAQCGAALPLMNPVYGFQ